jgi:hypothetical protein
VKKLAASMVVGSAVVTAFVAACVGTDPEGVNGSPDRDAGSVGNDGGAVTDGSMQGTDATASDSASAVDAADGAISPLDVRALPGLRLWLESTKTLSADVGTGFGSWRDSSERWDGGAGGGAPDGGYHVALPHNVNPPSIVPNGINGRPTVSFTAGNGYLHLDNHADFQFGTGDFLIVDVAKVTSGTGPLWRFAPNATAGSEELFTPGHLCVEFGMGVTNGCTAPDYVSSPDPHVFAARRKGDVFDVRVDGAVRSTLNRVGTVTDIGVNEFAQPYVFIGSNITMQLSEVIVIVGPTSDANVDALESLLKTKYAIP